MALIAAWSVGKHRIEATTDGAIVRVSVDEVDQQLPIHTRLLGQWPLTVGKRRVLLRRVRNLDVPLTELWVNGVRIPPSEVRLPRRKAPAGATCECHGETTREGGYRDASAPPAKVACAECGRAVCSDHLGADGVRCNECFGAAVQRFEAQLRKMRVIGPAAGALLGLIVMGLGAAAGSGRAAGIGLACIGLMAYLVVYGLYRERVEARERERVAREMKGEGEAERSA